MRRTFKKLVTAGALASIVGTGLPYPGSALAIAGEPVSPQSGKSADTLAPDAVLKDRWGVELVALRRTANGHMLDFRYRVLDAEKAAALFKRQAKPSLMHQRTGRVLAVPNPAKIGPLRNSNNPKEGRVYWMFFGNAGGLVQTGDKVTVAIGEFRAEDLTVE